MSLHKYIFIIFITLGFFSCSNELDVTAEWKSIPVVYALVDITEDVNYFRIEKAFLDPEISGATIAQIPDSLYFDSEVLVRLTNLDNDKSVILERVNLQDEGFEREEGVFATSPNIGYKYFVADLEMGLNAELKLELIGANETILTEATTTAIGEYTIPTGTPGEVIRFAEDRDASFGLRSDEQSARFYDCTVTINYDEESIDQPGVFTSKSLDWELEQGLERAVSIATGVFQPLTVFKVEGQEFYMHLGNNIEQDPTVIRYFRSIDLAYVAGGEDLLNYVNIGLANTGITSNQIIPTFTNFNNDAIGVFSSRISLNSTEEYSINTEARDSLRDGRFTRLLNFN